VGKEYWALVDPGTITQRESCDGQFSSHISSSLFAEQGASSFHPCGNFQGGAGGHRAMYARRNVSVSSTY